ncbi:hypothetical protein SHK09_10160 [Polaribacter sp. PL03]|uniref:hypothetical protein n=1 Tax=Polaribacter sp. PL03 TaxID=3088353 RepID=UPI0029CB1AC4|nr:hypothetical protein [Polaribacter sp. PL03]MDX6747154.1 hypothetical protein [Polaribacter sp. PL03]
MEKKSETNQAAETNPVVDSRIAAVRDLIFGENIQQYNSEFEDVFNRITALQNATQKGLGDSVSILESKLADLESLMDHKIQDLNDDLDKKIAELDDEKTDRKKLGKALEKIALMLQE